MRRAFESLHSLLENPAGRVTGYLIEGGRVGEGRTEGLPFSEDAEGGVNFPEACAEMLGYEGTSAHWVLTQHGSNIPIPCPPGFFLHISVYVFLLNPDSLVLSFVHQLKFRKQNIKKCISLYVGNICFSIGLTGDFPFVLRRIPSGVTDLLLIMQ